MIPPVIAALDVNKDGKLDKDEIANATKALLTLDKNNDGELQQEELRPPMPPGGPQGPPKGPRPGGPGGQGGQGGGRPQGPPPQGQPGQPPQGQPGSGLQGAPPMLPGAGGGGQFFRRGQRFQLRRGEMQGQPGMMPRLGEGRHPMPPPGAPGHVPPPQ